jgi:hypothetical protein
VVGGGEEPVAIRSPDGSVIRLAQLGRTLANGLEHGSNVGPRACDDAKNLAGRPLPLLCFMQFAGEPGELCFLASRGTATDSCLWRIAAVSRCRLTARFDWFTACLGAIRMARGASVIDDAGDQFADD